MNRRVCVNGSTGFVNCLLNSARPFVTPANGFVHFRRLVDRNCVNNGAICRRMNGVPFGANSEKSTAASNLIREAVDPCRAMANLVTGPSNQISKGIAVA